MSSLITNLIIVEDLVTSFDTVARDTENQECVQHSCALEAGGGAPSSVGRHPPASCLHHLVYGKGPRESLCPCLMLLGACHSPNCFLLVVYSLQGGPDPESEDPSHLPPDRDVRGDEQTSPSFMSTAWLVFKTFFASLLPEGPPAIAN